MPTPISFIKNLAIEIDSSYNLNNIPHSIDEFDDKHPKIFIGRKQHIKKFLSFLRGSNKGVFLITGFRGMGKTSFVNHVIKEYIKSEKKGNKKIRPIHLTLAQNKPREVDILRLMASSVYDNYKSEFDYKFRRLAEHFITIFKTLSGAFILLSLIFWGLRVSNENDFFHDFEVSFFIAILLYVIIWVFQKYFAENDSAYNRIIWLMERCHSLLTEELIEQDALNIKGIDVTISSAEKKRSKQYPIASIKEIEYELQKFLSKKKDLKFIFIFDELDKVETVISNAYMHEELDTFEKQNSKSNVQIDLRDKKQAILNIISGLKNFFTTANARFIFIAGHEMFDASLADIADRQSSISSIFTYTFNIESLLKEREIKDSNNNNASLSNAIEEVLKEIMFGEGQNDSIFSLLSRYKLVDAESVEIESENKKANDKESIFDILLRNKLMDSENFELINGDKNNFLDNKFMLEKLYFTLQNFIAYLTYRSNGSPKKLLKAIHEFILIKPYNLVAKERVIIARRYVINDEKNEKKFIYFNYHNQYRIGFLSYLYRPFLIKYGRTFKLYSDNIILSTPYLFDHLLKFHPFAFSITNLELIPEVLSTSKTITLKDHIREIINYLGSNHLRETEIDIFDYKFYSRTLNEISFLSKIFEEESAAFNFTLDESYLVKLHVNNKIKELRSIYSKFLADSDETKMQPIFSIAHLNGTLGDLHFFDQEYDDAIVSYSDAIKPINQLDVSRMNVRDFVTLITNKLKLGLCFEKIQSFQEALAFYSDASQDAKRFLIYRIKNAEKINFNSHKLVEKDSDIHYETSSMNDLLQIIIQGFLAQIIIEEKMGIEGVTTAKISLELGGFISIANRLERICGKNHLIIANAYLHVGKLLYFKNSSQRTYWCKDFFESFPEDLKESTTKLDEKILRTFECEYDLFRTQKVKRKPVLAFHMYISGFLNILQSRDQFKSLINNIEKEPDFLTILENILLELNQYLDNNDESYTSYHFRYMASFLSNIGDCLLGMCRKEHGYRYFVGEVFNLNNIDSIYDSGNSILCTNFSVFLNNNSSLRIAIVLKYYYLSGKYFFKYGRSVSCSFQYRKILHILRMILKEEKLRYNGFIKFLETTLVTPILEIASDNAGHTDRHMFLKATQSDKIEIEDNPKKLGLNETFALHNISNQPETREAILALNYIKIKMHQFEDKCITRLISPYYSFASQFSRIIELDFHAKYLSGKLNLATSKKNMICNMTAYVFSMLSILRILKIYGIDYMISYSSYAYTHFRLAEFLRLVNNSEKTFDEIDKEIKSLFGSGSYSSLDYIYHFQMAKNFYQKAIELHTAGNEYKKTVGGMIYLEDDFNDNAYHFGAAYDRYMMINGAFESKIQKCNKVLMENPQIDPNKY